MRLISTLRLTRGLVFAAALALGAQALAQTDPLPSWNDGPAKKAIVEFVHATTTMSSPTFAPPETRIPMLVLHDDAKKQGWIVISMKDDWKQTQCAASARFNCCESGSSG